MSIYRLDHLNFITNDMQSTIEFYTKIIGLVHGNQLASASEGMEYFYIPNQNIAILHIGHANIVRNSSRFRQIATSSNESPTGVIDHFCLKCNLMDYDEMIVRLNDNKIPYDQYVHPDKKLKQIWVSDPNNVRVELSFCD